MFEFIEPDYKMSDAELVRWVINNNYNYYVELFLTNTDHNIYRMDEETLYQKVCRLIKDEVYYENTYDKFKLEN